MLPENGNLTDLQSECTDSLPPHDHTEELCEDEDPCNTILSGFFVPNTVH